MDQTNTSVSESSSCINILNSYYGNYENSSNKADIDKGLFILKCAELIINDPQKEDEVVGFIINHGNKVNHNDIDDAKKLLKVKGIENNINLGWDKLKKIRRCMGHSYNTIDLDVGEKRFGDLRDDVNLESYIISLKFNKAGIYNISDDSIKKYVALGLKDAYLNKHVLEEIKNSGNYDSTIKKIIYGGLRNTKKKNNDKKYGGEVIIKICNIVTGLYKEKRDTVINMFNGVVKKTSKEKVKVFLKNMKKFYLGVDCAVVEDIIFTLNKVLVLDYLASKGDYPYGTEYPSDQQDLDTVIDELLKEMEAKT